MPRRAKSGRRLPLAPPASPPIPPTRPTRLAPRVCAPQGTYGDHMLSAGMETDLTRLVFRRLDGPSIGPISTNHVMGVFDQTAAQSEEPPSAVTGRRRLDLISVPFKPQVAARESATTQLWLRPLPTRVRAKPAAEAAASGGAASGGGCSGRAAGSASAAAPPPPGVAPIGVSSGSDRDDGGDGHGGCSGGGGDSGCDGGSSSSQDGPLCYDEVFGIFDCRGQVRLRIGSGNFQERWSSRLRIVCVQADAQAAAGVAELGGRLC